MKNLWRSLQEHATLNEGENRVYRIFNYLLLIGILDITFLCFYFRNIQPPWPLWCCLIELVSYCILLMAHRAGHFAVARYITVLLTILMQIMASLLHGKGQGFEYILLVVGLLPLLFFSKPASYVSLFVLSMASIMAVRYIYGFYDGPRVPIEGDFFYYWNIFFTGTMIFIMMYFFKVSYDRKEAELISQNDLIRHQKEEIEVINEKLEAIITDRTEKIRTQESRMSEYAHIHAHQVRSPLARILGFVHLIDREPDPAKALKEYLPLIRANADELNEQLRQVSKTLETFNHEMETKD
jgi:signal transduction histidine kinase